MISFLKAASLTCIVAVFCIYGLPATASSKPLMPIVYILHGYAASADDHWFAWLQNSLAERGIEAHILSLPDSSHPSSKAWADYLDQTITREDRETFFVAHSLGCIALLRYLQRQPAGTRIGGMLLVSGFSAKLPSLPQLDDFVSPPVDYNAIIQKVDNRRVIAAQDDPIVPYALSASLAIQLKSPLMSVEHGGHFLASDGFVRMPQVLVGLLPMIEH